VLFTLKAESDSDAFGVHVSKCPSTGRICVDSGRDGRLLKTYTDRVPGDTFGFDAVGIGDVDGDGEVDLLLTAAWSGCTAITRDASSSCRAE
jgi:hypothetical protein